MKFYPDGKIKTPDGYIKKRRNKRNLQLLLRNIFEISLKKNFPRKLFSRNLIFGRKIVEVISTKISSFKVDF